MAMRADSKLAFRNPQQITFQSAQEAFLLRCRAQNLSLLTIGWYKGILGRLERFLDAHGIESPKDITPTLLRGHFSALRDGGQKSGTVFRTFGGIRCFFGFLSREKLIPENPMSILEKPRKERVIIPALTLDQMRILLSRKLEDEEKLRFPNLRWFAQIVTECSTGVVHGSV